MFTIKDFLELINYRITEGSDYFENSEKLFCLSFWNGEHDGFSAECIFSLENQKIHSVSVCDYKRDRAYRYYPDPDLRAKITHENAWDMVDFVSLEVQEDFIEKAEAILSGKDYDDRVLINLEFPEEELMVLFKEAHRRDITFNQLVIEAIKEACAKHGITE